MVSIGHGDSVMICVHFISLLKEERDVKKLSIRDQLYNTQCDAT